MQGFEKHCRGCRYWYSPPIYSNEPIRVGWCRRAPVHIEGKDTPDGISLKTSEGMGCGEWEPEDAGKH